MHAVVNVFIVFSACAILTFILGHLLGVFDILQQISNRSKRKRRNKKKQPEHIELQAYPDPKKQAKERKRKEEVERRHQNEARRKSGFYSDLGNAYNEVGGRR